jgi:AsmA-like C-terminal region
LTRRTKKWLAAIGAAAAVMLVALLVTGYVLARRVEPFIREQVIAYLHDRFDSEVEVAALRVRMRRASLVETLLNRGHGLIATVEGDGVQLRHKGRRDLPPMFAMKQFRFDVELRTLLDRTKVLHLVTIDGMAINLPPKGQRPDLASGTGENGASVRDAAADTKSNVLLEEVIITNAALTILPNNSKKFPLHFDIHRVRLQSAGQDVAMKYEAALTNAKPRGEVLSNGTLGPWVADEPGDSHLAGDYVFTDADLGVFSGISGVLESSGQFEGTLSSVNVKGEATVPDFRLKEVGNPVRLQTRFEVRVDGTSGDTILRPVNGSLGATSFRTSGGIIRHEADLRRTISLNVSMPSGNIDDLLSLAMKGTPFMRGKISLNTKIDIPPLTGSVREKLLLDGQFQLSQARFLKSTVQDQIDTLSRRGRGQPNNTDISGVVSLMAGKFTLANEMITFQSLSFAVPGSGVDLSGTYDLDRDTLDFHGTLRLQAKVSETMTGWKRWVLKPIDPFFAKQGAGTLLRIQVVGTSKEPKFGRDRGKATGTD